MTTIGSATGAYAAAQSLLGSGGIAGKGASQLLGQAGSANASGFAQMLQGALDGVSGAGRKAEEQAVMASAGKANLVDVVTAVAESETALQTLVAVRDRVISAYEEIMRMPI